MEITVKSHAKVNLYLKVVGRRPDGYHEIRSVFSMISLCDTLSFSPADDGGISLSCDNPDLPVDGRNLVVKAAEALRRHAAGGGGALIRLEKKIPVAAGLGGGSSNAAAALTALNEMWGMGLSRTRLMQIAVTVGADVPFFLCQSPMAWVEGIGEKITPLAPSGRIPILLVKPGFGISAEEAYRGARVNHTAFIRDPALIADMESGVPERVSKRLANDLEPWALESFEELSELKKRVESSDPAPLGVVMSGSGPAFFAVYRDMDSLARAAKALKNAAPFVAAAQTLAGI